MIDDKHILIRNVYYMLSYAYQELRQNNYEDIAGEEFDEIHDLFAEIICHAISFQLKQGLYREYIPHSESIQTQRGRILIAETINEKAERKRSLVCEFDEMSPNNLLNKIVKTTATLLVRHSSVKKEKKQNLKRLLLFFNEVDLIEPRQIRWQSIKLNRINKRYEMLLNICYFVLDGMLLSTEDGSYRMREFTDEHMNLLFQRFVMSYYRKTHPEFKAFAKQIKWDINPDTSGNTSSLPIMQTDIMLTIGDRKLIIDTKYYGRNMTEHFGRKTLHSNNLYQIQTYVHNEDVNHSGKVDGML